MNEEGSCQVCGSSLESGAPEGLCPACLLGAGLGETLLDGPGEVDMIAEKPGDLVGRYRLVEQIGEGGFGVVFRAEQELPVKRVVAVKVIKPGMDSKEVIARFEAERQALALMDHPNIARVYDAGTTDYGRPYFVMEYVAGEPITTFCDERKLGIRERLRLFGQVCGAVQHAHHKSVIHRDLKPSNILVSENEEGEFVPKIIDFGVAKAISIELTEKTFFTMFGRMMGTPQYMSPEQAELNAVDVDTRSDIFSLGVVLYELMTGCVPLEDKELSSATFDEMRRMIREDEPLKPSARVFTMAEDGLRSTAAARKLEPSKFRRHLSGDLDWIVMKALEKDRNRRYDNAHGLAVDLRRYLRGLPVSAGPPGAAYRFGKFVRRHRIPVVATILGLLALIGATVGAVWSYSAIHREWASGEYRRLSNLLEGISKMRAEMPGSRGQALQNLGELGRYDLTRIDLEQAQAKRLRSRARNKLIACLEWTDLEKEDLMEGLQEGWTKAACDADFEHCVLGFSDGRIEVRELAGERRIQREGTGVPVRRGIRFSPDGRLVAARFGSVESWQLLLFDWDKDREVVSGVEGVHDAFDFHPDAAKSHGAQLVVGSAGGLIRGFRLDGTDLGELARVAGDPEVIRLSPDGRHLAVGIRGVGVQVIALADGEVTDEWPGLEPASLAWAPAGPPRIVVGGRDGSVIMLERGVTNRVFSNSVHGNPVDQVAWNADGRLFASGNLYDATRLWDGRQGELLSEYPVLASSLSFSRDLLGSGNCRLGPVISERGSVSILKVGWAPVCHRAAGHRSPSIKASAWSIDGTTLATAAEDGVRFWNRKGTLLDHLPGIQVKPGGLVFSDTHLYLVRNADLAWSRVSVAGKRLQLGPVETLAPLSDGNQIALSPAGTHVAVACGSEVVLLDAGSGSEIQRLPSHPGTAYLAFGPAGMWLASGSGENSKVEIWEMAAPVTKFKDLGLDGPSTVAFYPLPRAIASGLPGPFLMTGNEDFYQLWRWDSADWVEHRRHPSGMANPWGRMARMAFSPKTRGTAVIVSCDREFLRVLHATELVEMAQPSFDEQWPLTISPDGRMMATEAAKGRLFLWDLEEVRTELKDSKLDWTDLPPFAGPVPALLEP